MRRLLLIILLVVGGWWPCLPAGRLLVAGYTFAQTPTSPPGFTPACDPCGFCVGGEKPASWERCVACLKNEGYTWTVLGCIPTKPGGFIQAILKTTITMIGGAAFLTLIYGGFVLLTSEGNVQKINKGKTIVASSVVGLLLIIFSVFILRLIGYKILKIPGFGE